MKAADCRAFAAAHRRLDEPPPPPPPAEALELLRALGCPAVRAPEPTEEEAS